MPKTTSGEVDGSVEAGDHIDYDAAGGAFLETTRATELVRVLGEKQDFGAPRLGRLVAQVMRSAHVGSWQACCMGKEPVWKRPRQGRRHHLGAETAHKAATGASARKKRPTRQFEQQLPSRPDRAEADHQGGTDEILRGIIARGMGLGESGVAGNVPSPHTNGKG